MAGTYLEKRNKILPNVKGDNERTYGSKNPIVRSTKRKHTNTIALCPSKPVSIPTSNEIHIRVQHISKLYTDDTGKFPVRLRSGNQYIIVTYHCDSNAILAVPFT